MNIMGIFFQSLPLFFHRIFFYPPWKNFFFLCFFFFSIGIPISAEEKIQPQKICDLPKSCPLFEEVEKCSFKTSFGCVDWIKKQIFAYGSLEGASEKISFQERNQTKAHAKENLLLSLQGIYIDSKIKLGDGLVVFSQLEKNFRQLTQNPPFLEEPKMDAKNKLVGFVRYNFLSMYPLFWNDSQQQKNNLENQPKKPPVVEEERQMQFTSLILDARKINLKPALFPKIYDASGGLLMDFSMLPAEKIFNRGYLPYAKNIQEGTQALDLGSSPFILEVAKSAGVRYPTDLILGKKESAIFQILQKEKDFFQENKVLILVANLPETF